MVPSFRRRTIARVNHPPGKAVPNSPDAGHFRFLDLLQDAVCAATLQRLLLTRPTAAAARVERVAARPLLLRGQACLSFVYSEATRDITKNLALPEGLAHIRDLLGAQFRNAHLFTAEAETQVSISKKGKGLISVHKLPATTAVEAEATSHDRAKHRWLTLDRPFLAALGITTAQGQVVPAMARKWKQINKFVEIFDHALASSALAGKPGLRVADFGAGRAYLTFAVHDWLTQQGLAPEVSGIELRADLVEQGNAAVATLGLRGLQMVQGDVRSHAVPVMDVMIALHACDTATDHAIHLGLQADAQIILCSPCCHKELRPQLLSPGPLRSIFQHGIHAEQQAEMLTDTLRALLLQAQGYDTQVFEFVALEHTRKNKMILAVKRAGPPSALKPAAESLAQVQELKRFFGVRQQCLETLLAADPA